MKSMLYWKPYWRVSSTFTKIDAWASNFLPVTFVPVNTPCIQDMTRLVRRVYEC
jgi:hypothetical protein